VSVDFAKESGSLIITVREGAEGSVKVAYDECATVLVTVVRGPLPTRRSSSAEGLWKSCQGREGERLMPMPLTGNASPAVRYAVYLRRSGKN